MDKDLMIYFDEEGVAKAYDDTYDITIHCESEEEQQKAIEQLKSLQWIPCSERIPEYGEAVLTVNDDEDYEINHVIDEDNGEWFYDGAIAWMPLPEPYKGEEYE